MSASASEHEPGLVVVMPTTGKICYWESISSAATLDLIRKKQNGLEGAVPSMFAGETVVQILNAETAGFVLAFSSGRLAYMSVRDGQGRPAINVQFLHTKDGPRHAILSSVRNILSGPWRGDIAAIRAGPSTKVGERDIVMATSKGRLQAWTLHRGGHNFSKADMNVRDEFVEALKKIDPAVRDLTSDSFKLLDLVFSPNAPKKSKVNDGHSLVLLTSMTSGTRSHYALIEVTLGAETACTERVIKISSYTAPLRSAICKPRLYLPAPGIVAFIVFDRSVVLVSMATQLPTPEMQLVGDIRPASSTTFEDVIDFRDDLKLEIIGSGEEEPHALLPIEDHKSRKHRAKCPGVVLLVRGAGLVRIAAIDTEKLIGITTDRLSAKSKLEQAVFFRMLEHNPLSFTARPEHQFDAAEIGKAALELSKDIVDSQTSHVSSVSAVIEQHLGKRSAALRSLADHLKETNVMLDRSTRWLLMADAEKLFGATRVWKVYETAMKNKPVDKKQRLLADIIEYIHEDSKTNPVTENGEVDIVRFWFINDISTIYRIVPWTLGSIRLAASEEWEDELGLCNMLIESEEYVIGAIGGAYEFREKHLELYGLQNENIKNGFVESNLQDLPEPWTGTYEMASILYFLLSTIRAELFTRWTPEVTGPAVEVLNKLASDNPKLTDLVCKSIQEHYRWGTAQIGDAVAVVKGKKTKEKWMATREELLDRLVLIQQTPRAIELAVKHEVLPTAAYLIYNQLIMLTGQLQSPDLAPATKEESLKSIKDYEIQIDSLYQMFGDRWATAVFEHFTEAKACHRILLDSHQAYMTRFLRPRKEFAKIAWINEVKNEKNIQKGAEILLDLGNREQQLWSKKVEWSIGKLAHLAGRQGENQDNGVILPDGGRADLIKAKKQLSLIKIQEQVFQSVLPAVSSAIDEKAAVELALKRFGNRDALKDMRILPGILESHMAQLIAHKALDPLSLIDLLTLMATTDAEPYATRGREFHLALKVLHLAALSKEEQELTERVIWRRCFIRDNWSDVNNTVLKDDGETAANLSRTALFSTLKACVEDGKYNTLLIERNRQADFPPDLSESAASFQPLRPSEVVGAFSDVDELGLRFSDREESAKTVLAADMSTEDDRLEHFMQRCQLEKWWQECVMLAKEAVDAEVHQKTVAGAEMKAAAEELRSVEEQHFRSLKNRAFRSARALLAPLHHLDEGRGQEQLLLGA